MTTETAKLCGDHPAPCNCDNPENHDGAVEVTTPDLAFVYEWAYSVVGDTYAAILPQGGRYRWFDTKEEAEKLRRNDLRFRLPTLLIKRLVGPIEEA